MKKDCPDYKLESTCSRHARKNQPASYICQTGRDEDPMSFFYSDSDEGRQNVNAVRVNNTGSGSLIVLLISL